MFIEVDASAEEPLYRQIRDGIVAGIATGELTAGMQLPPVRVLAADLGINLHTVNKAYAVLRDEGYIRMKGRTGAFIADADDAGRASKAAAARDAAEDELFALALAYRANGGTRGAFLEAAAAQAARAFGAVGHARTDDRPARSSSTTLPDASGRLSVQPSAASA